MNTRLHKSFLIPLSILLVLLLASCAQGSYPGETGTASASSVDLNKTFQSSQAAQEYLNQFTIWEAESDDIEIGRPRFTIVNNLTNGVYQNSSIEASIPYRVSEDTPPGKYSIQVTMYTADRSDSIVLGATLKVAESEKANSRRSGTIQLIVGIILVIAGIVVFIFSQGSSDNSGCAWVGGLLFIGVLMVISGIRLLVGS